MCSNVGRQYKGEGVLISDLRVISQPMSLSDDDETNEDSDSTVNVNHVAFFWGFGINLSSLHRDLELP